MGTKRSYQELAKNYIAALGGRDNIDYFINCATRIRAVVIDDHKVAPSATFINSGATAVVKRKTTVQIIDGLGAQQVQAAMQSMITGSMRNDDSLTDEYGLSPVGERAVLLYECLGLPGNVERVTVGNGAVVVQVKDIEWVDPFDILLQLGIGITHVVRKDQRILIYMADVVQIARELNRLVLAE